MIRMRIETKGLEKLVRDLKRMRFDILRQSSEYIMDLSKSLNESYTTSIDELVYDEYNPVHYERTGHLRGAHGALIEVNSSRGDVKNYSFYIDEDSRDPVDGTTWGEKADKIEAGSSKMTIGYDRPFVKQTQDKLEWETKRLTDALVRKYEMIIRKVGGE